MQRKLQQNAFIPNAYSTKLCCCLLNADWMNIENVLQEQNNSTEVQFFKYLISMVHDHVYNSEIVSQRKLTSQNMFQSYICIIQEKKSQKQHIILCTWMILSLVGFYNTFAVFHNVPVT